ncbi:hypothetical protein DL96DRAFT_1681830 [Flagelloscypha sp. PMI_526]|nr:hypothetical protein DL96DRAFT_1681830 [Flagelloscypha sp. PMI_526]
MSSPPIIEAYSFRRFSDLPCEIQREIWQHAAWAATKPEQARLSLISQTAKLWQVSLRTQEILYHTVYAENAVLTRVATILQEDLPSAVLFRDKTRSLWLVSWHLTLRVLRHFQSITKLYIQTDNNHVLETLQSIATLPVLKEIRLPPHYCHITPLSPASSTLTSNTITHMIIRIDMATESPSAYFWTLFPKLTHFAGVMSAGPDDHEFESLCNHCPENLVVLDQGFSPLPVLKKRFSRKPVFVHLIRQQRDWDIKTLWEHSGLMWDLVDTGVQEARERNDGAYFINAKLQQDGTKAMNCRITQMQVLSMEKYLWFSSETQGMIATNVKSVWMKGGSLVERRVEVLST